MKTKVDKSMTGWAIAWIIALLMCSTSSAGDAVNRVPDPKVESGIAFLSEISRTNVLAARFPLDDGTIACPPQAKRGYRQFFLRDYAYVLEGCADVLPEKDLLDAARLFLNAISREGAGCDFVGKDGRLNYQPGGGRIGKNPVVDGTPFTVAVEYLTWRQTRSAELLSPEVLGKLAWAMERGVPRNPQTGLVHIRPHAGALTLETQLDRAPYGFTDVVRKQGDVLFGSLLYCEAATRLSEMFDAAGRPAESAKWRETAKSVKDGVNRTLWDEKAGLYLAASHTCRQADVWGSAFAVWLGVAEGERADRISRTFVLHYDGLVQNGQVRHLLPGEYWQLAEAPKDTYQNGGFWGVASGWFALAIARTNIRLAKLMLSDLVRFYREKGVPEWSFNGVGKGYLELEGYLASTTVPLSVFRRMDWTGNGVRAICQVTVNGEPVEVVRTPMPENRLMVPDRHPYYYAAFTTEAPAEVSVCLNGKVSKMTLAPGDVRVVESDGRHGALVVAACRVGRRDIPKRGDPGVKYFDAGFHRVGRIELKDGETLYLAPGAWVEARVIGRGRGMRICGSGVLSGASQPYRNLNAVSGCDNWVNLSGENVSVSDVTLFSSWAWTLVLDGVTNAVVDNVKILGGRVINDDGIDVCRSRDVVIRNCFIRTQDDCLAAKWWCENLVVSNCTLWSDSANAIRLGYECAGADRAFRNLLFKGNEILHLSIPKPSIDDYWANAAITIQAAKEQSFEDIVFDGLNLKSVEPGDHVLVAKTLPIAEGSPEMTCETSGVIRGLALRNISIPPSTRPPDILLSAHDEEHPIFSVSIERTVNLGDVMTRGPVTGTMNGRSAFGANLRVR